MIFLYFSAFICVWYPANVVQMLQGKMKWDFHAVKGKACISYWELNLNSGSVGTVTKWWAPNTCCKIICQTSVFVHTSNSSAVLKHVEVALNMRHRNCCQYSSSSATEYFNLFAACCTHIYNLVKTSYSKDYKSIIRTCDIWLLPFPVFALCSVWWAKKKTCLCWLRANRKNK